MRVFISHSSRDDNAVQALEDALRARGFKPWADHWELGPGDDFIAKINRGLDDSDAALVVFSTHAAGSRWVGAEVSYLTYARVQEGKVLIPLKVDDDAFVPPLLRPLIWRRVDDYDAIAEALHNRRAGPPPVARASEGRRERVVVALRRAERGGVSVAVTLGNFPPIEATHPVLPPDLLRARDEFLRGPRAGATRHSVAADRQAMEENLAVLGRELGAFCLPGDAAEALAALVDVRIGATVEVMFDADDPELLGLPFEAIRLPDGLPLATRPGVVTRRRPAGVPASQSGPLAGPIKVLVAVGAPDEGQAAAVALDHERELQNILDAVEPAQRLENVQVRILEVGHPGQIREAYERDAYHVLHLSCHGGPGVLELEDEDGHAVPTTAAQLVDAIRPTGRPLPLVFLNACHGGVAAQDAASFSESLLRAGVPAVLAMQASVSDRYATALALAFYRNLALRDAPRAGPALAAARREIEDIRQEAIARGAPASETQPEYATPALYVAGDAEAPLSDSGLDRQDLQARPVYAVHGPVPQLRVDDLIGRRKQLRDTLRAIRDPGRAHAGVVLTGIGGVGKSAVAGRAMQRLREEGRWIAAHVGRFDLRSVAAALGVALLDAGPRLANLAAMLSNPELDDRTRLALVGKVLAEEGVVLVLDDFEQNLAVGGGSFLDPDFEAIFGMLVGQARRGRFLITCRHPIPGFDAELARVDVGPLSRAESRKLVQRLEGLRGLDASEIAEALRVIGGHPRVLEFLDALLRDGKGRLPGVTRKLRETLAKAGVDRAAPTADLDEHLRQAVLLGMRDVLLDELVDLARESGDAALLFQAAVSNLPTSPGGLAHMLADAPAPAGDIPARLARLSALSLIVLADDGSAWVHRWTAEGLARLDDPAAHTDRCNRAGRYRWWRATNESHVVADAWEAARNHLAGADFDTATGIALACFEALRRLQQSLAIAALANEVLEFPLPIDHPNFGPIADQEAQAHLALGLTDRAFDRYRSLLDRYKRLAAAEPGRADYQRDLSVAHSKMGNLYRALGQVDRARRAYEASLAIAKGLAAAEPDRADYQRDLSIMNNKVGDLYRALILDEEARQAYEASLAIRERLAAAEPGRADYQRDLSVAHSKVGDLHQALGQVDRARRAYEASLAIAKGLAAAVPDRADYQHDLSLSQERMGDLYAALGQVDRARPAYEASLAIRERLAAAEPGRADYQRDLSVAHSKVGDLYRALGQVDRARRAYEASLAIAKGLAAAVPDRADYQVDLAVSLVRIGAFRGAFDPGPLREALAILLKLQSEGRLAPADEPKIEGLREMLERGGPGDDPAGGS